MGIDWGRLGVDFQQKYELTYVRIRLEGQRNLTVFLVKRVQVFPKEPPELHLFNSEKGSIVLRYDTDSEIYFDYPPIGYSYYNNTASYCFRRTGRRWIRGVCDSTINYGNPYFK